MQHVQMIAAIGTPLDAQEHLHEGGLAAQLERLWTAGIEGIFAAGTLGVMPLLTDQTYAALIRCVVPLARGRAELLVGAGDLSLARTMQRIAYINEFDVDGVVVIPPYFMRFGQQELIEYFRALADFSRAPLYLYDVPQHTHTHIDNSTVLALADYPNIAGIKCSGDPAQTLQLIESVAQQEHRFRVIVARLDELSPLLAIGIERHLDGMFALAPNWAVNIATSAMAGTDTHTPCDDLVALRDTMRRYGGMSAFTVLMNVCGVPGSYAPLPFKILTSEQREALLNEPIARKLLATEGVQSAPVERV